ncbi:hypothetical protein IQ07DRAFT_309663 [Pyrenochaeta sp. DS3sAY3a]|nr:hypothetical protein IQ07DRAFT_309663 [Pyrenochaeta sp. DS3sAY3a]
MRYRDCFNYQHVYVVSFSRISTVMVQFRTGPIPTAGRSETVLQLTAVGDDWACLKQRQKDQMNRAGVVEGFRAMNKPDSTQLATKVLNQASIFDQGKASHKPAPNSGS